MKMNNITTVTCMLQPGLEEKNMIGLPIFQNPEITVIIGKIISYDPITGKSEMEVNKPALDEMTSNAMTGLSSREN